MPSTGLCECNDILTGSEIVEMTLAAINIIITECFFGVFYGISTFVDYLIPDPIYPTPPLGQDMTQGQFLSGV